MDHRLKVAVADDERDTREYLHEYLSHLGYDVRAAEDGRHLVELCREFNPDLVVTDYAMPGLDGWTAACEVNRERSVPVILFSGRQDLEPLALAGGSPVVKVLLKPVKPSELKAAVDAVQAVIDAGVGSPTE